MHVADAHQAHQAPPGRGPRYVEKSRTRLTLAVQVAPAAGVSGETPVEHIAVCAGSGSSVLRSAKGAQVCA